MSERTEAEVKDAIKVAQIKLEQAMKRMGGEAKPVPWAEVAAQATATERVLIEFLGEIAAQIELASFATLPSAEHAERAARYRAMLVDMLTRARLEVELEATENMLTEVTRMELTAGGAPRPRLVS